MHHTNLFSGACSSCGTDWSCAACIKTRDCERCTPSARCGSCRNVHSKAHRAAREHAALASGGARAQRKRAAGDHTPPVRLAGMASRSSDSAIAIARRVVSS